MTYAGRFGLPINSASALASDLRSELLRAGGETVPPRHMINSFNAVDLSFLASGRVYLSFLTAKRTESINTLQLHTGSLAAGATPTVVRYGVWSAAANGDLTLIASTPNDTTLLSAIHTVYPKALSATWNKQAGQDYAVGFIIVSGASMPHLVGKIFPSTDYIGAETFLHPRIVAVRNGEANLPASIINANLVYAGGIAAVPYWKMTP